MKTTRAVLSIELNVECPHCDDYLDLMDWDMEMNEEGELTRQACPDGDWSESHRSFSEDVRCPHCEETFKAEGIDW